MIEGKEKTMEETTFAPRKASETVASIPGVLPAHVSAVGVVLRLVLVAAFVATMLAWGVVVLTAAPDYSGLPSCEFEDSVNCYWDASEHGDGQGRDFVDIDGVAYYVDEMSR